jgi:excisionase family DNA binding protein
MTLGTTRRGPATRNSRTAGNLELLTYDEAEHMLTIKRTTLRKLVSAGELERVMLAGRPRIVKRSVLDYVWRQVEASRRGLV